MAGQRGAASAADCFTFTFGMVPVQLTQGIDVPPANLVPAWATIFTSMFMHAGWLHLGGNMLYLWIFGNNVEDRLGPVRFVLFYLACGVVAVLTQWAFSRQSTVPVMWDQFATNISRDGFNHLPGGSNVLWMDGHVSFNKYPSEHPVTKNFAILISQAGDALN